MSAPLSAESVIFPTMAPTPSSTDMGEDLVGEGKAWGLSTSVDLQDCHPDTIRDPNHIRAYVVALCELIGMKRYGDCQIVHFGDGRVAGYSMVQLIETSLALGGEDARSGALVVLDLPHRMPPVCLQHDQ